MRLPRDAVLVVIDGAGAPEVEALRAVWREEELTEADREGLEARLEALGATTLVLCGGGDGLAETARAMAALGYRAFVVSEAPMAPIPDVRIVGFATALAAAKMARARERLKAQKT